MRPISEEIVLYGFCGGLTTVISIGSFYLFEEIIHMNVIAANLLSWFISAGFAYVTNRKYVFKSKLNSLKCEIIGFYSGRVLTLLLETTIIFIFITILEFPAILIKVGATILVIILNYIIGKWWVFKK